MRRFFASLSLFLLASSAAFAANTPPGFDAGKWSTFVDKVAFVGEKMDVAEYTYSVFSHVEPADKSLPHQADYFSTVGVRDSLGKYHAVLVSAVSENWAIDEKGNWQIDQWIWTVSLQGELRGVSHSLLVETPSGSVLGIENRPVGNATDAAELERWGAKLGEWYSFSPFAPR